MKIPSAHQPGVLSLIDTDFGEGGSAHPSFLSLKAWRAGGGRGPLVCTGCEELRDTEPIPTCTSATIEELVMLLQATPKKRERRGIMARQSLL